MTTSEWTWEDGCDLALGAIRTLPIPANGYGPFVMDVWIDLLWEGDKAADPMQLFGLVGSYALSICGDPTELVDEAMRVLPAKQHDYGHGNIDRFGIKGVVVRLSDKWERYKHLSTFGDQPANESLHDTLLDLLGYATVGMMVCDGTFNQPLRSE